MSPAPTVAARLARHSGRLEPRVRELARRNRPRAFALNPFWFVLLGWLVKMLPLILELLAADHREHPDDSVLAAILDAAADPDGHSPEVAAVLREVPRS